MAEEAKEAPEVKEAPKEEDLVTRVSQFKKPEEVKEELDSKFNINDLDKQIEGIQDPALKEQYIGLKKSLLRGENQKYQEIANLRKQYESALAEHTNWTPERIQAELKNPNFISAAQEALKSSGMEGAEAESMLSERERKIIEENNKKVNELLQMQQRQLAEHEHNRLKQKYANYDSDIVENVVKDLRAGKAQINYEHIWRAIDYEKGLKRAYDLGAQDKVVLNEERVKGMSMDANLNVAQPEAVEKQKGESTHNFMLRSYQHHSKKK